MLTRDQVLSMLQEYNVTPSLLRHALASEAVMGALARKFGEDENIWRLTGLAHDLDFPQTENTPELHGLECARILADQLPEEALQAIRAHNGELNGVSPTSKMDYALRCGETVTGLIHAAALMRPTGFDGMQVKSVKKKMKDKAFAANVNRENIRQCEQCELALDEFLELAINAMAEIQEELLKK